MRNQTVSLRVFYMRNILKRHLLRNHWDKKRFLINALCQRCLFLLFKQALDKIIFKRHLLITLRNVCSYTMWFWTTIHYRFMTTVFLCWTIKWESILTQIYVFLVLITILDFYHEQFINKNRKDTCTRKVYIWATILTHIVVR